ncbi:MAG: hypothetical protein JWO72_1083 [Caulobacteraceae bacterium]|jgi:hypothetical protein|nr:hypothetical protein [Caulobacteraceae bacterium]
MNAIRAKSVVLGLMLLAAAGCTSTGTGAGESPNGAVSASFTWMSSDPRTGEMTAMLSSGQTYQGAYFQVTRETTVDQLAPLWIGWDGRARWHGWGAWGPTQSTLTEYTGRVLANLDGPGGHMRCTFQLIRPAQGMAGGGQGRCQLPDGTMINATFPPS